MKFNYTTLKVIAIAFGLFTFIWMVSDFLKNKKSINKNYKKANQAFLKKDYSNALNLYGLALKEEPENLFFLEGKARTLFRLKDFKESEKIFKEVIIKDNNFVAAIANLGILYDTLGNYELAIEYYELAVSKDSRVTEGISWLKRFLKNIQFKPSNVEERLKYLKKSIKSKDKNLKLQNTDIDKIQPDFEM